MEAVVLVDIAVVENVREANERYCMTFTFAPSLGNNKYRAD